MSLRQRIGRPHHRSRGRRIRGGVRLATAIRSCPGVEEACVFRLRLTHGAIPAAESCAVSSPIFVAREILNHPPRRGQARLVSTSQAPPRILLARIKEVNSRDVNFLCLPLSSVYSDWSGQMGLAAQRSQASVRAMHTGDGTKGCLSRSSRRCLSGPDFSRQFARFAPAPAA